GQDDRRGPGLHAAVLTATHHTGRPSGRMSETSRVPEEVMAKKKKVRVDLRKNRTKPPRQQGWTRGFQEHGFTEDATTKGKRVRAKGDLSRRRTIIQDEGGAASGEMPAVDTAVCLPGRVLRVHGLYSIVETEDGRQFRCAVRRLLRSLSTDE